MTDSMGLNMASEMQSKALEVMSDVIQAFLAALSAKSTKEQQEVLRRFADYVKTGGMLTTTKCSQEAFEAFKEAAKEADLTYYAALDNTTGNVMIITKDKDVEKVMDISKQMAAENHPVFENPQLPVAEYTKRLGDKIMYVNIDSYDRVEAAKGKAAELGAHFAVARKNDGSYMVIAEADDIPKLAEAGVITLDRAPMIFGGQTDLQDVQRIVKERRDRLEQEKQREREERKERGRE